MLVKCYFGKRKLVWEVLESGLKSKIEVQWSDITGLKATCPENKPATLVIEVWNKNVDSIVDGNTTN